MEGVWRYVGKDTTSEQEVKWLTNFIWMVRKGGREKEDRDRERQRERWLSEPVHRGGEIRVYFSQLLQNHRQLVHNRQLGRFYRHARQTHISSE